MVKALVTGGTGFIGHHMLNFLLDETDWEVIALDSLTYAGNPDKVRLDPRLRLLYSDLRAPLDPGRVGPVDYIFNLASASHVDRSIEDPVPFVQNNVALALHMLEFARVAQPRMFIQFSTDEVYGPAGPGVLHEEWSTILPSNPYSASKAAQEAIAFAYWRTFGVPVVITNTMNVFGENQHPEKFVPKCIERIRMRKKVPIHGENTGAGTWASGSRHWIYARDVAEAAWFISQNVEPNTFPELDRPSRFHIVGDELSNEALARRIAEIMDLPLRVEWVDYHASRPGHDRRYALDGSRLANAGWKPTVGLEEGLWRTVEASRS